MEAEEMLTGRSRSAQLGLGGTWDQAVPPSPGPV